MIAKLRSWIAERRLAVLCSAGLASLSLLLATPWWFEQAPAALRLSAGPAATRRHAVAEYLCGRAAKNGLAIDLSPTVGSEDCLYLLKAGQLDAAIVSNGVTVPDDEDIVVLSAIQAEAVHVLVRKELTGRPLIESIRGKRVNVGERGSTEWLLAHDFLAFGRLSLPSEGRAGDVVPTEQTKDELLARSRAILQASGAEKAALIASLPDCLIVLAAVPSALVQQLVEAADYQLVPLPATRAFLMDNLQDSEARETVVQREFLERITIPVHSYFTTHGFPAADCETVGVRLLVVARRGVAASAIRPLMQTLFEGEFAHRLHSTSPRELPSPYSIHPAAEAYLDRNQPLAINAALEWLSEGLSIFGAFSAGALSLYSLLRRRKARQPTDYYAEIRKVEQVALSAALDAPGSLGTLELIGHLDQRLLKLRQELIEDICEGRTSGEQRIANILALLKDTRRHLQTLERDSAEAAPRLRPPRYGAAAVYAASSSAKAPAA